MSVGFKQRFALRGGGTRIAWITFDGRIVIDATPAASPLFHVFGLLHFGFQSTVNLGKTLLPGG